MIGRAGKTVVIVVLLALIVGAVLSVCLRAAEQFPDQIWTVKPVMPNGPPTPWIWTAPSPRESPEAADLPFADRCSWGFGKADDGPWNATLFVGTTSDEAAAIRYLLHLGSSDRFAARYDVTSEERQFGGKTWVRLVRQQ